MSMDSEHAMNPAGNPIFGELMTEAELIAFLRMPLISKAGDHGHVIEHLKRMRGLPCIHISKQPLYPVSAIREWIQREVQTKGATTMISLPAPGHDALYCDRTGFADSGPKGGDHV
jgi:hypothetical protein